MTVSDVLLRDPRPGDIDSLLEYRNLPEVNRWMVATHEEPSELRTRWEGITASETDFSCVAEVDGEHAGVGFLEIIDGSGQPGAPRRTEALVGYMVRPGFEGRGIATSIARGIVEAAFVHLGVRRVIAGCYADNLASVRVLEKAGLRREQYGRQDSWHAELGWIDGCWYGLLAEEWVNAPSEGRGLGS
ncbi:Protein N-acetyltransferase, RimJ/RimL family [Kytococcus aerolatus]|uniref:Protein N-acetyltransferase, RimJ/RimL family n=1 Tax=Kytococcus aerolatus TaxID=592308 RepID=A0A212TEH4_9MICO|nr:GNAT family N-acetyltransferase [Kytococcus aerolatus]SNC64231.1 Protein N-acetyltransferase, RimJ/RimL family [Kytococcus aerolatus]